MARNNSVRATLGLGVSAVGLMIATGGVALAQDAGTTAGDAPQAQIDTITVTGFRAALQSAVESKRDSDRIVESISAEEIGKLPDSSIAESIARMPGLTTQRLDGRAQVISIRGFSPDFATTLLNGREQVTNSDNRNVEYDQYPSEVINRVDVYKTPDASIVGQGVSGTVNLQTVRPLTYGKQMISVTARGEYVDAKKRNPDSDKTGYRMSGIYVDQFADDTVGLMLGISYIDSPQQIEAFNAWGYPTDSAGNSIIGGSKSYATSTDLRRLGAVGALEFKPTDALTLALDGFYSNFKDYQTKRGIEFPMAWGDGGQGETLQSGYTIENGQYSSGTFNNITGVVRNDANRKDADLYSLGVNAAYKIDAWTVTGDVSWSKIDKTELVLETYSGTGRNFSGVGDTIGFTMTDEGATFSSTLDYTDTSLIKLTSPRGWGGSASRPGGQDGYYNLRTIADELYTFRGIVERKFDEGAISSVQAGVNFTPRDKSLTPREYFLKLKANTDGLTSVTIPEQYIVGTTDLSFLGLGSMVAYDPIAMLNSGLYDLQSNADNDVRSKGWTVSEDIVTGWVMANIDGMLGTSRLTGNFGVQVVVTDQSSSAVASTKGANGTIVDNPVTEGAQYTDVLPSLNLALRMDNDMVVRFGAAREMARPRMDDMRAAIDLEFNDSLNTAGVNPWSGKGGNPKLRPWRANALDLSVEKYFGGEAYLALAGFWKDLKSYIIEENVPYDFSGFNVNSTVAPITYQGEITSWVNGKGGKLYGAEASGTLPFRLMTPALDGFGVTTSVSYTISKIKPSADGGTDELPGYSKWVTNTTAYFEKAGFSVRASMRTRSKFVGELRGFGGGNERKRAAAEQLVDAQIGYEFQPGTRLEGLSIQLQGYNLTNEAFKTYDPKNVRNILDYQEYGKRYLLGFSYKY